MVLVFKFQECFFALCVLCDSVRDKRIDSHTRSRTFARVTEEEEGSLVFMTNMISLCLLCLPRHSFIKRRRVTLCETEYEAQPDFI